MATVNKVDNDPGLLDAGIAKLARVLPPGWRTELVEREVANASFVVDAILEVADPVGERLQLLVEIKTTPTPKALQEWVGQVQHRGPWLLVARRLSRRARAVLREANINFVAVDEDVISIRLPRIVVEIDHGPGSVLARTGARSAKEPQRFMTELFRGASLRVVRRLLIDPTRVWGVTELAEATDVSKGMVSRVLATLVRDAYAIDVGGGRRKIVAPQALLDDWAVAKPEEIEETRVVTLLRGAQLKARLRELRVDWYALTGEAAAEEIAPFTRVAVTDLYYDSLRVEYTEIADAIGARETTRGANVVLLRPPNAGYFDGAEVRPTSGGSLRLVARPQLYVDLVRGGGAGPEAATYLKERGLIWPSTATQ